MYNYNNNMLVLESMFVVNSDSVFLSNYKVVTVDKQLKCKVSHVNVLYRTDFFETSYKKRYCKSTTRTKLELTSQWRSLLLKTFMEASTKVFRNLSITYTHLIVL